MKTDDWMSVIIASTYVLFAAICAFAAVLIKVVFGALF